MISPLLFALAMAQGPSEPMLVSTSWLADHLNDRNIVLFQIGVRPQYDSVHIPGARFIELREFAAPVDTTKLSLELPDPAVFDSVLESYGVSDDSRIVVYWGREWFSPSTRVYLTLFWAGLGSRTSILDGGLPAWVAEGRPVTTDVPVYGKGRVTLSPRQDVVVEAPWVAGRLQRSDVAVIDARTPNFYAGAPDDTFHARPGHIAGARNIPFNSLLTAPRFLAPDSARAMFRAAGADPGDSIIAYCHIGQQATVVWFMARLLGYDVRLYDGSFTEWTRLMQYPVERSQ